MNVTSKKRQRLQKNAAGSNLSLAYALIKAAAKLKDEYYRFLLLMSVALLFGGSAVTLAFGPFVGLAVVALVVIFVLSALFMRFRFSPKIQSGDV